MTKIEQIQTILGVVVDDVWGKKSQAALDAAAHESDTRPTSAAAWEVHHVKASSFADPADVRAFRLCKAAGGTDQHCFFVGDNGIGKWGDDTTKNQPMCALPPEDWKPLKEQARGAKVLVTHGDKQVVCELRDTMPARANIKNGAGIDLNPAACAALGLRPPMMADVTWHWA